MNDPSLQAQVDAASAYEALMVPALFRQWAATVADAAEVRAGERVLDVACGTGILAREASSRTGPGGSVAGLDPNPGMLEVARRLAPDVAWRQGTAESLPFPGHSFDVVVSQFGFMFFQDRSAAVAEALRVLVPGGRLAVAVWDTLDSMPAYAAEVALLERLAGRPAADALRAPFVLGEPRVLTALLQGAGFSAVTVTTRRGTARFPGVRVMVEADLRGWLPVMGVVLPEETIARILGEAEAILQPYARRDGTVVFDTSAHVITGARS